MNTNRIDYPLDLNLQGHTADQHYATSSQEEGIAVLTVRTDGTIADCNASAGALLNCDPRHLLWQHISTFFPQLAEGALVIGEHINPNLRFLSRVGYQFESIAMNGFRFSSKLFFVEINNLGERYLRLLVRPASADCLAS